MLKVRISQKATSEYVPCAELNLPFAVDTNGEQAVNLFVDIIAVKNGKRNILKENIIYGDNMPNKSKLTIVRSIRASREFWEKCEEKARQENLDTNKLVVRVVTEYCKEVKNDRQ